MIAGSLLILVVAAGMLVAGLMKGNDLFLIGSILASLIAGIGLYTGARASARRAADEDEQDAEGGEAPAEDVLEEEDRDEEVPASRTREPARARRERYAEPADDLDEVAPAVPSARRAPAVSPSLDEHDGEPEEEDELPDEPGPMTINRVDRTRLAGLTVPVQVVDGRPRYHLAGCVHLLGKEDEPLPVNEAVELGFTPCALCEPTADVLADLSVRSGH